MSKANKRSKLELRFEELLAENDKLKAENDRLMTFCASLQSRLDYEVRVNQRNSSYITELEQEVESPGDAVSNVTKKFCFYTK